MYSVEQEVEQKEEQGEVLWRRKWDKWRSKVSYCGEGRGTKGRVGWSGKVLRRRKKSAGFRTVK